MDTPQPPPILERLLRLVAEKSGSDLYLSPGAKIMMKRSGSLVAIGEQTLDPKGTAALLEPMITASQMQLLLEHGELNTSIPLSGIGRFRLSAFKQRGSISAVFRYIPRDIPNLADANLPPVLGDIIMERRGLVLVVGATSSGKSTTIASMLQERNEKMPGHILTIEDPIEFLFRSRRSIVNQREVGTDCETIHIALKNALRQAPDCIFIGEIRDLESMQHAIAFSQSGHLCVSTLHAANAYQALTRIVNFYPADVRGVVLSDLSISLKAVISQRLARTPTGGRIPVNEILINTPLIADMIHTGELTSIGDAIEKSLTAGSQTYEQALAELINAKKITREEGMALADSATNLSWRLQNQAAQVPTSAAAATSHAPASALHTDKTEASSQQRLSEVDFSTVTLS